MQEIQMMKCPCCGNPMPLLRLTKFGYNFCVDCSNVEIKRGVPITRGTGEDTWVDLEIVTYAEKTSELCVDYNLYFEEEEEIK